MEIMRRAGSASSMRLSANDRFDIKGVMSTDLTISGKCRRMGYQKLEKGSQGTALIRLLIASFNLIWISCNKSCCLEPNSLSAFPFRD